NTFQLVVRGYAQSYAYAKDAKRVYYHGAVMADADAATFAITMDDKGIVIRDRNRHYQNGM
uniref:DKNYY domain-containing protein n=1 Tax=Candidatus Amarolinea aalborgensis TaxID=2249329 RepID=UPI003BF98992